jgi:hypothetical protein
MGQKIAFSSMPMGQVATPDRPGSSDDFNQVGDLLDNGTVQWGPTFNGKVPDNPQTVLSVQPNSHYETRSLGTAQAFEVVKFDGSALTIRPNGSGAFDGPTIGYVIMARAL